MKLVKRTPADAMYAQWLGHIAAHLPPSLQLHNKSVGYGTAYSVVLSGTGSLWSQLMDRTKIADINVLGFDICHPQYVSDLELIARSYEVKYPDRERTLTFWEAP